MCHRASVYLSFKVYKVTLPSLIFTVDDDVSEGFKCHQLTQGCAHALEKEIIFFWSKLEVVANNRNMRHLDTFVLCHFLTT